MDRIAKSAWPTGMTPDATMCGEGQRAAVMASYGIDALTGDSELTEIVRFVAKLCDAPIALVSLVEQERQRFLAREGLEETETPRDVSFCAHTMLQAEPMVITDATTDPRFADNALVTGPMHLRFYAGVPLVSEEGAPLGALCVIDRVARPAGLSDLQIDGMNVLAAAVMRRLSARRSNLEALRQLQISEERFRLLADSMPDIAFTCTADGVFDYYNQRFYEYTGIEPDFHEGGTGVLVHESDRESAIRQWERAREIGEPYQHEHRLRRADGEYRWMLVRALPLKDESGNVVRWSGTVTDIDDSRRLSDNRDLLARELSHRIKNIFAVVAGLVSLRARRFPDAAAFSDDLIAAIRTLGRAHDFVRPIEGAKGDSLAGLLNELMAPYADESARVAIAGDDCVIGHRAATPLALVFHELATNSAKYGSLSAPEGRISIHVDCADDSETTRIAWRETGGPATEAGSEGFGSRLVQMAIEGQLNGSMERRFEPAGLEVDLTIPTASIHA